MGKKVSICIATYNMRLLLGETIANCQSQDYENLEIIIFDDASTDGTEKDFNIGRRLKYIRGTTNQGVGKGFSEAIKHATGDYIVLMCADDLFTNPSVISDIVGVFDNLPKVGYVSRYYYQFVDGYPGPVRAWRTMDPIIQANNPSGLAFRREALLDPDCLGFHRRFSNKMFIETSYMAKQVIDAGWDYWIITYDTIAARVHQSTSTKKGYWLKRRVSSPVADWVSLGATDILKDYPSFIQIKNGFTIGAVLEEIGLFIKLRPLNLLMPRFWFFALVALLTPRFILRKVPLWYRHRIGRLLTKEVKREG